MASSGPRFGFRDTEFVISEGETRSIGHGTGYSLTLNRFSDEYNFDGSAKEYTSDLVLLDNGDPVKSESITVNDPLTYRSVSVYQSSFGQTVMLRVTDQSGNPLYEGQIPMGIYHSTANPDAPAGTIDAAAGGRPPHGHRPGRKALEPAGTRSAGPPKRARSTCRRDPLASAERNRIAQQAIVFTGDTQQVGNLNVEFVRNGRYVVLQVGRNPGIPIFIIAVDAAGRRPGDHVLFPPPPHARHHHPRTPAGATATSRRWPAANGAANGTSPGSSRTRVSAWESSR